MNTDALSNQAIIDADDSDHISLVRELCEKRLSQFPTDYWTLEIYSRTLASMALYSEAESAIDRAEQHAPQKRMKWILSQRGSIRECQGRFQEAEILFLGAHAQDPQEATFLIFAGSCAFRQGHISRAAELARRATTCGKGAIDEAFHNLGGYLSCMKRFSEAQDCYKRATEIDPDYEAAFQRLEDIRRVLANANAG